MMPDPSAVGLASRSIESEYHMRVFLLGLLLSLADCKDHKRTNIFDATPSENNAAPYNGMPERAE